MFERYTEKARRVIFFARYEASQFGSQYIEAEHLLLGVLREDKALAIRFLGPHAAVDSIRKQIELRTEVREKTSTSVDLPLSFACKRILAYGAEEAEKLDHKHIGTGHLLLGILRDHKGLAGELLRGYGLELAKVRTELFGGAEGGDAPQPARPARPVAYPIAFVRFSEEALRAALFACQEAGELGSPTIDVEHLLLGALREDRLEATLRLRSDAGLESIRREIAAHTPPDPEIAPGADLTLSHEYQETLSCACEDAERLGHVKVSTGHLLLAILGKSSLACEILQERGLTRNAVSDALSRG